MLKKMLGILVLIVFSVTLASAQESGQGKQGTGMSDWLKSIQKKIARLVPKKTVTMSTSVAGVRGARESSQARLYWKGKEGDDPVTEDELAEFKKGIDLASQGDAAGAAAELQGFMKKHPDSALIPDAKKTLDLAQAEPQKAEVAKDERKAEQQ